MNLARQRGEAELTVCPFFKKSLLCTALQKFASLIEYFQEFKGVRSRFRIFHGKYRTSTQACPPGNQAKRAQFRPAFRFARRNQSRPLGNRRWGQGSCNASVPVVDFDNRPYR